MNSTEKLQALTAELNGLTGAELTDATLEVSYCVALEVAGRDVDSISDWERINHLPSDEQAFITAWNSAYERMHAAADAERAKEAASATANIRSRAKMVEDYGTDVLAPHGLPGGSADELWHEVIAVRDGEKSEWLGDAWAPARTREQIQAAADALAKFSREWEEMEEACRDLKDTLRTAESRGITGARVDAIRAELARIDN